MIKTISLALILVLTGCVTAPAPPPIDPKCDQLATYARGITVLKQAGISASDVDSFTSQPVVAPFPVGLIKSEVYARDFKDPAAAYVTYYDMCVSVGYGNMFNYLKATKQLDTTLPEPKKSKSK